MVPVTQDPCRDTTNTKSWLVFDENMQHACLRSSPHSQAAAVALTPRPGAFRAPPLGEPYARLPVSCSDSRTSEYTAQPILCGPGAAPPAWATPAALPKWPQTHPPKQGLLQAGPPTTWDELPNLPETSFTLPDLLSIALGLGTGLALSKAVWVPLPTQWPWASHSASVPLSAKRG